MSRPVPRTTEKERRALIRKWENQPSLNPEFKGVTPRQAARKLLRTGRARPR